ncbi:hypothetical protein [uncultured Clostridium sp.]|nr:hypothetical protein [uncultured Clostridium sp.]
MATKGEKKRKNDNKTKNSKTANPITMQVDPNMNKPVRGLART